MLIDDQFRKCTTFLFVDEPDEETGVPVKVPAATAFFAAVPTSNGSGAVPYLITARHVIDKSRPYGPLVARINMTDGYRDFTTNQENWAVHPSTDVAAHRVALPLQDYDVRVIPLSMLADDEYIAQNRIGFGDDVFFVGLFSEHPGYTRNQPIIRFGNISLMPDEKIHVRLDPGSDTHTPVDAYLVEARSWGGHSGSPAFVFFAPDREAGVLTIGHQPPTLLGLVHGHYEIRQDVAFIGDILGGGTVPVNAGMAVVIPSQEIIATLMQDELIAERREIEQQLESRRGAPNPDVMPIEQDDVGSES